MSFVYLLKIRFQLLFTTKYCCNQTYTIRPTNCQSWNYWHQHHPDGIYGMIRLETNIAVGRHSFHYDLHLNMHSSELLTSFCYHLPDIFQYSKLWLHNHLSKVQEDRNQVERKALRPIYQQLCHSSNVCNCWSTAMQPMQPPKMCPGMPISTVFI
jgi:hypothetical protein